MQNVSKGDESESYFQEASKRIKRPQDSATERRSIISADSFYSQNKTFEISLWNLVYLHV